MTTDESTTLYLTVLGNCNTMGDYQCFGTSTDTNFLRTVTLAPSIEIEVVYYNGTRYVNCTVPKSHGAGSMWLMHGTRQATVERVMFYSKTQMGYDSYIRKLPPSPRHGIFRCIFSTINATKCYAQSYDLDPFSSSISVNINTSGSRTAISCSHRSRDIRKIYWSLSASSSSYRSAFDFNGSFADTHMRNNPNINIVSNGDYVTTTNRLDEL